MDEPTVDDMLISAWIDGALDGPDDAADKARVEAWMRDHPEAAARARQWAADAHALRSRLAPMLDEPVPQRLSAVVWRRSQLPRWALAASAAGLLLLGGALGALVAERQAPAVQAAVSGGWVQRAAYAHSVYVPEPRHPVEVRAQEEHLSRWLTNRIKVPVKLFDLQAQGFSLVGGRLLPDGAGKSAQLMYQDAAGARITIYLRKPEDGAETAFRYEQRGELGLFYWVEAGCGFALVGPLPRERLLALAQAIYEQQPQMPAAAPPQASGTGG